MLLIKYILGGYDMENELSDHLYKFEGFISAMGVGNCIVNTDSELSLIYANQGFYDIVGYTQEDCKKEIYNGGLVDLIGEDFKKVVQDAISQEQESKEFKLTTQIKNKIKNFTWVYINGRLEKNDHESGFLYIIMIDISEHMVEKERLQKELDFNNLISSLTEDAFFDYDILNSSVRYSKNYADRFKINENLEDFPQSLIEKGIIPEESLHLYTNIFNEDLKEVLEAEINHKLPDGTDVWYLYNYRIIFNEDDIPVRVIGKMTDITKQHKKLEELTFVVNEEQQFKVSVINDSLDVFEFNLSNNSIIKLFDSLNGMLDVYNVSYSDIMSLLAKDYIHPDDIEIFNQHTNIEYLLSEFHSGKNETIIEYRKLLPNGDYMWVRATTSLIQDTSTGDIKGLTYIKDVHKERMLQIELKHQAERDSLTGLLNKTTTENFIKNALTNSVKDELSALLIIDVDNFKNINDKLGHLSGDIVLTSLADKLKMLFRSNDIIGRVGGDEFFVFMKNITLSEIAVNKAKEINKAFRNTYKEKDVSCSISASIGIAFFPEYGADFESLYKNADIALYITKEKGKDSYTIYQGQSGANYHSTRTEIDSHTNLPQKSFKDNRVEYLFKILYSSRNTKRAVESALKLMTDHFHFSRGFIFETNLDNNNIINTIECCGEGVEPLIQKMQNISFNDIYTIHKEFYDKGYFVLQENADLTESEKEIILLRDIKTMFYFGIFEKDILIGVIGFDDCKDNRHFKAVEIDELTTVCNVLATFITKQRSAEAAEKNLRTVNAVMDNLDNFTYVIDAITFEILFMNQKTKDLLGVTETSGVCYQTFRDNNSLCEDCPVKGLSENISKYSLEIHNTKFNLWTESTASYIDWVDGKKQCLVNCVDISKYKNQQKPINI